MKCDKLVLHCASDVTSCVPAPAAAGVVCCAAAVGGGQLRTWHD
jgi:hypothetical protein